MKYDEIPTFEDLKKSQVCMDCGLQPQQAVVSFLGRRAWAECEGSYPVVVKFGGWFLALGLQRICQLFILIEHKLK